MSLHFPEARLNELAGVLVHVRRREFEHLATTHLHIRANHVAAFLSPGMVAQLAAADWLAHLNVATDREAALILRRRGKVIDAWANAAFGPRANGEAPDGLTLTLSDERYAHTSWDRDTWLDLVSEEEVKPAGPCVTHITVDMVALMLRVRGRLTREEARAGAS